MRTVRWKVRVKSLSKHKRTVSLEVGLGMRVAMTGLEDWGVWRKERKG
jgi:hypothetical protein